MNKSKKYLLLLIFFGRLAMGQNFSANIVNIAKQEIGHGERGQNNCGKYVKKYMQGKDDLPWCTGFVSYVINKSGYEKLGYPVSAKQLWNKGKKLGLEVKTPKAGDIICFWRNSPNSWQGHIGIIEKVDSNYIYTIEGNLGKYPSNVKRIKYKKDNVKRLLGYLRIS